MNATATHLQLEEQPEVGVRRARAAAALSLDLAPVPMLLEQLRDTIRSAEADHVFFDETGGPYGSLFGPWAPTRNPRWRQQSFVVCRHACAVRRHRLRPRHRQRRRHRRTSWWLSWVRTATRSVRPRAKDNFAKTSHPEVHGTRSPSPIRTVRTHRQKSAFCGQPAQRVMSGGAHSSSESIEDFDGRPVSAPAEFTRR